MQERYLTLAQNTCSGKVFLNTFGLVLDNFNDVNEFSLIKIFDNDKNIVGNLHFNNGRVIIVANYNNNSLNARYNISKIHGFRDIECNNELFGEWSSKIEFTIVNNNGEKIYGEFFIECSIDSRFGIKCLCHPLINYENLNGEKIVLKILRNGRLFGLEVDSGNYIETIDIRPWDDWNGFIKHVILIGKYDSESFRQEYKKYMGIFTAREKDKLHVFLSETKGDEQISFRNEFPLKIGDDNSTELVIQKGMLMQDLDPQMYKRISDLRELLAFGDVFLLDNIFSVCYDRYSNEELEALLGIKRKKMNYQDGADNLKESYFGIGKNNQFLSESMQKKIFKSYNNSI